MSFDEVQVANIARDIPQVVKDVAANEKKKEIINWEPTPLTDTSKLTNQYLMLSKIRLTSRSIKFALQQKR